MTHVTFLFGGVGCRPGAGQDYLPYFSSTGASPSMNHFPGINDTLTVERVYLIVVKMEIVNGTANDIVSWWIDPTVAQMQNANAPVASKSWHNLNGQGVAGNDATGPIKSILLFRGSGNVSISALRVATEWSNLFEGMELNSNPNPITDAALTTFVTPGTTTGVFTNGEKITVRGKNVGTDTLKEFNFTLEVDGVILGTETIPEAAGIKIAPDSGLEYEFVANADLSTPGSHKIRTWIDVAGDVNHNNDTISLTVTTLVPFEVTLATPYKENFNSSELPLGWVNTRVNGNKNWTVSNNGMLFCDWGNPGNISYVTSTILDLVAVSSNTVLVEFDHAEASSQFQDIDTLIVYYKAGVGGFEKLGTYVNGRESSNPEHVVIPLPNPAKVNNLVLVFEERANYGGGIYVDNLVVRAVAEKDVAAAEIISPTTQLVNASTETPVMVRVKNSGTDNIESLSLTLEVNSSIVNTEVVTGWDLPQGEDSVYTFKADLSAGRVHTIRIWADLDGDVVKWNDTVTIEVENFDCAVPVSTYPLVELFENPLNPCWKDSSANIENTQGANAMGIAEITEVGLVKNKVWRFSSYNSVADANYSQYLISPQLSTDILKKVSFIAKTVGGGEADEGLAIGYSTTGNSISDFTWYEGVNNIPVTWTKIEKGLIPKAATYIAVKYYSGGAYSDMYIDSLRIDEVSLSVADLRVLSFVDFPTDTVLAPGITIDIPVKISVRNDSTGINNFNVAFVYHITSDGVDKGYVYEQYTDGAIAKGAAFDYTFLDNADIMNTGTYDIKAWAEINGYINLHNDTAKATLIVVAPIVTDDEVLKPGFKAMIYPNPSNGDFTVTTSSRSTVEVLDVKGVIIERITVDGSRQLSLKGKGVYVLRFTDAFGNEATQRVIVK
jgi:hypothetical protein